MLSILRSSRARLLICLNSNIIARELGLADKQQAEIKITDVKETKQMSNLQLSRQAAAFELLARRKAKESLIDFTKYTNDLYRPAPHHELIAKN
jgi:hypothetical protein